MRILFCGDVVGRSGRAAISQHIPQLKKDHKIDLVVVNGENAASGFGITEKICNSFVDAGVDVITGGDHVFDQKETMNFIGGYKKLLRPDNLPDNLPGAGHRVFDVGGRKALVIHLHAQLFMKLSVDCPFKCADKILKDYELGKNIDVIVVDFHCEATSEKMALGQYLDGRVSMVAGSHTHVPTADAQILPNGTAYQTDAGMCGDYDSVIGWVKQVPINNFLRKIRTERLTPALGDATLCGVFVETDEKTGLAKSIAMVRVGGRLEQALPA